MYLSDQQEALLGCGPFYRTDCDIDGIDLFNAEASVLLQSFPSFEPSPSATRFQDGQALDPPRLRAARATPATTAASTARRRRASQRDGARFRSNFAEVHGARRHRRGRRRTARSRTINLCATVRGLVALTGSQRPELRAGGNGRFGRRTSSGTAAARRSALLPEAQHPRLLVRLRRGRDQDELGRRAHLDRRRDVFGSNTSRNAPPGERRLQPDDLRGPPHLRQLPERRTARFFFNAQLFVRYLPDYNIALHHRTAR